MRQVITSVAFGTKSKEWHLRLDMLSSTLYLVDFVYSGNVGGIIAEVKVGFVNADKEKDYGMSAAVLPFSSYGSNGGCIYCFTPEDLIERNLVMDDKLKLCAEVTVISNIINTKYVDKRIFEMPICTLTYDLANCLVQETFCDVSFLVDGHKFQAHKGIIAARSTVLADIIDMHTKENNCGPITLTDLDHVTFHELLNFLYIGTAPNLHKMPTQLLKVADRYALPMLKVMCEVELCKKLTAANADELLKTANLYKATQLKEAVLSAMQTPPLVKPKFSLLPQSTDRTEVAVLTQLKVEKLTYDWIIKDFKFCCKFCTVLTTPHYINDAFQWHLYLNLAVFDTVTIALSISKSSFNNGAIDARIYFFNGTGDKINICNASIEEDFPGMNYNTYHYIAIDDILKDNLLSEGDLKICLELERVIFAEHSSVYNENTHELRCVNLTMPECKLKTDLQNLLKTEKFSDVRIIADGGEIRAHKFMLAARSSVFAAMFKHNMKESIANCVSMPDVTYETLKELLHFIYTGDVTINAIDIPFELLVVADKYDFAGLKVICERTMFSYLSLNNAVTILIFADLYKANNIKALVTKFIKKNKRHLKKMVDWEKLKQNYSHLIEDSEL